MEERVERKVEMERAKKKKGRNKINNKKKDDRKERERENCVFERKENKKGQQIERINKRKTEQETDQI